MESHSSTTVGGAFLKPGSSIAETIHTIVAAIVFARFLSPAASPSSFTNLVAKAAAGLLLVADDSEAPAFQIGEAVSHGLQLIGRVSYPVHKFTDDLDRLPAAVSPGRIAGELLVRHVEVVFEGACCFHDIDPAMALPYGQFSAPRCGIQGCRRVDVVRSPASSEVRAVSGHQ